MDVDKPGKDSYELRKAGAAQTIVASQQRWALMTETPDEEELDLHFLASRMDTSKLDLILVEGFKHEEIAKIVLFRDGAGHRPEELVIDRHVIAVASDVPLNLDVALLDINDVEGLADFVRVAERTGLEPATPCVTGRYSNRLNYRSTEFFYNHRFITGLLLNLMPGSSLLSHGETPHYHRRYGVSLLSSAWGQVGPPR